MVIKKESIIGTAIPIVGNDIDTDRIVPARFLKEITFEKMGQYLFYDSRYDSSAVQKSHILNDSRYQHASMMVVNKNFGCGSSREHAPQAIMRAGFQAIIGESYSEIFSGNCAAIGIVAVTAKETDIQKLQEVLQKIPHTMVSLNLHKKIATYENTEIVIDLPESRRLSFLQGTWDALGLLQKNETLIHRLHKNLPY